MLTVLPVPTFLSAKAPVDVATVNTSDPSTPVKPATPVFSVAAVVVS